MLSLGNHISFDGTLQEKARKWGVSPLEAVLDAVDNFLGPGTHVEISALRFVEPVSREVAYA